MAPNPRAPHRPQCPKMALGPSPNARFAPRAALPAKSHFDPERKFGLVTKFDILIRAKRNGLERPSESALQSLTGVRVEPAPVAKNDAFWLP
jgi:hypothetical protein